MARLDGILKTLGPILPEFKRPDKIVRRVDVKVLSCVLKGLSPYLGSARRAGFFANPWEVAGIGRREVRNAAVLASLWDPRFCGDAGLQFLDRFVEQLRARAGGKLPTYDDLAGGYLVRTEHCPLGDVSERVDITIEGMNFLLGIEIKIGAREGFMQLERYVRSIERRAQGGKEYAVIFLAPFAQDFSDQPEKEWTKKVTTATWSDVVRSARRSAPAKRREKDFALQLISSFASHISKF